MTFTRCRISFLGVLLILWGLLSPAVSQELRSNGMLVTVAKQGGALCVKDERSGLTFEQKDDHPEFTAHSFTNTSGVLEYFLTIKGNSEDVRVRITIPANRQVEMTLSGKSMKSPVEYPPAWKLQKGDELLLPVGTGVQWPVALSPGLDEKYFTLPRTFFWSRCLSMGLWGVRRNNADSWIINALGDASDATLTVPCVNRVLAPRFAWTPELGQWGYQRSIRFILGPSGGLTAACKAYRQYRKPDGFGIPLLEKAKNRPQIKQLAGAANIWLWHDDYATLMYGTTTDPVPIENIANIKRIALELKGAGVDRVLWGLFFYNDAPVASWLKKECGYLVTKYDNYQDVMPEELQKIIPKHRVECCDFTARRNKNWPNDIRQNPSGTFQLCWRLYGTDGKLHHQNAMCQRQAAPYIRDEVKKDVKDFGYEARFIDCMGTHISTCFNKNHPMTRRQCRQYSLSNFKVLHELGLLAGTEEGIECYLPGLDYSEGKQSVFPYRVDPPMCWRYKSDYYADEDGSKTAYLAQYMLNPLYRVPLWFLVYHECSVEYWYWGDACNNVPTALPRRDLFNILYGTPPMYSFKTKDWPALKEKIIASYRRSTETAKRTCFNEMISFDYLTPDRLVQQTVFEGGTKVIVNFSRREYKYHDEYKDHLETIKPLDYRVFDLH
ncbi:MAG: glycoside hydrolase [Thermoguttaceae bacterium]|nr:glycoside hydrolase [Thermoguttaceae bacterium]